MWPFVVRKEGGERGGYPRERLSRLAAGAGVGTKKIKNFVFVLAVVLILCYNVGVKKKNNKEEVLQVRLFPDQMRGLEDAAKLCKVKVSALVRMLVDNFLEIQGHGHKQDGN